MSILKAVANITSDQILALHTAPVVVVPAPGLGLYIVVLNFSFEYVFNTTPYSRQFANNVIGLTTDAANGFYQSAVLQQGFIDQSTSQISAFGTIQLANTHNPIPSVSIKNKALSVAADVAPLGGDGTLNVIVYYTIESVL